MSPEWVAEINRRDDDIESGRVREIPAEEVVAGVPAPSTMLSLLRHAAHPLGS
jgi:Putative addiction module component